CHATFFHKKCCTWNSSAPRDELILQVVYSMRGRAVTDDHGSPWHMAQPAFRVVCTAPAIGLPFACILICAGQRRRARQMGRIARCDRSSSFLRDQIPAALIPAGRDIGYNLPLPRF
ncbi:hypothetical protein ACFOFO_05480, partial [Undibacterium arcticum]